VAPIPFSHSAGLLYFMIGIKYGMSTVIMPRFAPLELVKLIKNGSYQYIYGTCYVLCSFNFKRDRELFT